MGIFWSAIVPWNLKTDLIALFVVAPFLLIMAFVLSSLFIKVIKNINKSVKKNKIIGRS